ncbi:dTDP-4-dehydrorhamnose 3,5-epimerase/CDP-3, 6-dideoxy-D-glycero-D-glycero-4-hexulose-5-epimerase [Persephonella hydrogeniphila]|uniref:dTDP-4-dehydrorhamnose 3,5-epimerase n=1 Tax=Persephonella hydrogeniphila TaxID=198703 RepID=A0A285N9T2_9AQUI|nr:dTDP-4-dehydrorhamnose 3,5-epimerase [Persephonella hydrogeniphila]SNZ06190.1 dTDP-4-dehydrorhamnose 3,5-epimerase/CDP-3, 6-dideoxy-D-glycero-D-glycero-4-hexulose-5-epimerase [Persephonella hydrogeniphila]
MKIIEKSLNGIVIIKSNVFKDNRGVFIKTYHKEFFEKNNLDSEFRESFFSVSKKNVIRGMHFQTPPDEHAKLVYCAYGKILDVVVDIRKNSPTYGQFYSIELTQDNGKIIYIPKGFAHGFKSLTDNSVVIYLTTKEYSPKNDSGIRWDSFGFDWEIENPIISNRDKDFLPLSKFDSPFIYEDK